MGWVRSIRRTSQVPDAPGGADVVARAIASRGRERFGGEELAGAGGRGGRQVGMGRDRARLDAVSLAQVLDQCLRGRDLPRRRRLAIQVADQADADPVLVDVRAAGVPAMNPLL